MFPYSKFLVQASERVSTLHCIAMEKYFKKFYNKYFWWGIWLRFQALSYKLNANLKVFLRYFSRMGDIFHILYYSALKSFVPLKMIINQFLCK